MLGRSTSTSQLLLLICPVSHGVAHPLAEPESICYRRLGAAPKPDTCIPIAVTTPIAASSEMVAPLTLFSAGLSRTFVAPARLARERLV